jgi:hypothetical protein
MRIGWFNLSNWYTLTSSYNGNTGRSEIDHLGLNRVKWKVRWIDATDILVFFTLSLKKFLKIAFSKTQLKSCYCADILTPFHGRQIKTAI